jgi:hypothetical protein
MDKYAAHGIEKLKVAGTTQAVLNDQIRQFSKYKTLYDNTLCNVAMTFI